MHALDRASIRWKFRFQRVAIKCAVFFLLFVACLAVLWTRERTRGVLEPQILAIGERRGLLNFESVSANRDVSSDSMAGDQCGRPPKGNNTYQCEWVLKYCIPDGLINYMKWHYCWFKGVPSVSIILLSFWLLILFYILGAAAGDHFCPALSYISQKLNMSPDLAGITILALGNGAPDVFADFAAIQHNNFPIAMGVVLGAGGYVISVVVGLVSLVSKARVDIYPFMRDTLFYLIAIILVWAAVWSGKIFFWESIACLLYYVCYVTFATVVHFVQRRRERHRKSEPPQVEPKELRPSDHDALPAQIQIEDSSYLDIVSDSVIHDYEPKELVSSCSVLVLPPFRSRLASPSAYLEKEGEVETVSVTGKENEPLLPSVPTVPSRSNMKRSASWSPLPFQATKSPIAGHSQTSPEVHWNTKQVSEWVARQPEVSIKEAEAFDARHVDGHQVLGFEIQDFLAVGFSLETSEVLLARLNDRQHGRGSHGEAPLGSRLWRSVFYGHGKPHDASREYHVRQHYMAKRGLLRIVNQWKQDHLSEYLSGLPEDLPYEGEQLLSEEEKPKPSSDEEVFDPHRSFTQRLFAHAKDYLERYLEIIEWDDKSIVGKIFQVIMLPWCLLMQLTIPHPTVDQYNRYAVVAASFLSSYVVVLGTHSMTAMVGPIPVVVAVTIAALLLALLVFLMTFKPPKGFLLLLLVLFQFVASIMWIYLAADEAVSLMEALGAILGLSPAILSLTVLSWGNALGDTVADIVVAKQGFPEMAMAATYGGPLFNMLIGLGSGMIFWLSVHFPNPYPVVMDGTIFVGCAFGVFVLIFTQVGALICRFHIRRALGMILIFLYVLFIAISFLVEFGVIPIFQ